MEANNIHKENSVPPYHHTDSLNKLNDELNFNFFQTNEDLFSPQATKSQKTFSLFKHIINQYENDIQHFLKEAPEQLIDLLYDQLNLNKKESSSLSFTQILPTINGKDVSSLLDSINQNFLQYCSSKEGINLILALLDKVQPKEEFPFLIRIIQIYINHIKDAITIPNTFDILLFVINKGNNYINQFIYSQIYDYIQEITQNKETLLKLQEGILNKQNPRTESESLQKIRQYIEEMNTKP